MSDEVFFDGVKYISASSAAETSDLTRDYVARLCREGKVSGHRIGKNWYVNQESLSSFLLKQNYQKAARREELVRERLGEYHHLGVLPSVERRPRVAKETFRTQANKVFSSAREGFTVQAALAKAAAKRVSVLPGGVLHAVASTGSNLSTHGVSSHAFPPLSNFLHKILAITTALLLTVGAYTLVDADAGALAKRFAGEVKDSITSGTFERNARAQLAAVAENPSSVFTMFKSFAENTARTFNTKVH